MGPLLPLAIRRSFAGRGMMAVMALGIVVAAVLLASAPIYARAMSDLGLRFLVADELDGRYAVWVTLPDVPVATPDGEALQRAVTKQTEGRTGWYADSMTESVTLGKFQVKGAGALEPQIVGQPQSLSGYESHVRIVSGRLPKRADGVLEVAMGTATARVSGLSVGDTFRLQDFVDTCVRHFQADDAPPPPPCDPATTFSFGFPVVLTAIIEPVSDADHWWAVGARRNFEPLSQPTPEPAIAPMFADQTALREFAGRVFPSYRASASWYVYSNGGALDRGNYQRARADLDALRLEMEPLQGLVSHPLRDTLDNYSKTSSFQQKPLTILLLQITAIALFYVAIVAAMLIERQAAEIALLRSRGASMGQVLLLFAVQGLVIGIPAALAAPLLAAGATAVLGLTPLFSSVSNDRLLPVGVPALAFAMAAGGVLLSLVAFIVPGAVVARKSATSLRRGEARPAASFIQRYFIDIGLTAAAVLLLFELRQRGSVFTPSATGGLSSDPLLLASPALLIGAAAALILRFYPLLLRAVSRLTQASSGPVVSLGLWQVVRAPAQYTQLTLLLMMAVAVGTFAASYTSTVDRSYRDRAGFETGVDLRASGSSASALTGDSIARDKTLSAIPGVESASSVYRSTGQLATAGVGGQRFQLLAVDPAAAAKMLWTREDLADDALPTVLRTIESDIPAPGRTLPGKPVALSLWVNGGTEMMGVSLWARLREAGGQFVLVRLGELDTGRAWVQLTASLEGQFSVEPTYPLTLASILVSEPNGRFGVAYPPLYLDDITVADASGGVSVAEDFEGPSRWASFETRDKTADVFGVVGDQVHGGKASGRLSFHTGSSKDPRGIFVTGQITPIPVIVSTGFANSTGLHTGTTGLAVTDTNALIPIAVKGEFELFPTTQSTVGPVVVFNRDLLFLWADVSNFLGKGSLGSTEVWLSLAPTAELAAVKASLKSSDWALDRTVSLQETLQRNEKNPLIAAGGSGILVLAFVAVMTLVAAGLLASLRAAVSRRRAEFALVHAMGFSRLQLLRMLALEYAVVFVAGAGAGAILGLFLGRQMLTFLDVTEDGAKVEPPFILVTQWLLVGAGVMLVLGIFVAALTLATRQMNRTSDAQALRLE
ncbi:MAG: FtsX-like permease family protein [Tepidiformaceae bacterium]